MPERGTLDVTKAKEKLGYCPKNSIAKKGEEEAGTG